MRRVSLRRWERSREMNRLLLYEIADGRVDLIDTERIVGVDDAEVDLGFAFPGGVLSAASKEDHRRSHATVRRLSTRP